jgi:hypothetical protein
VPRFSSRPSEPVGGGEEPYSRTATNPDGGIAPVSAKNAALLLRLLDSKWPEVLQSRGLTQDSRADEPARIDVSARELVAFGPNESESADNVEEALAFALAEAARAGNWDVVSQLARLLEARFAQTSTR